MRIRTILAIVVIIGNSSEASAQFPFTPPVPSFKVGPLHYPVGTSAPAVDTSTSPQKSAQEQKQPCDPAAASKEMARFSIVILLTVAVTALTFFLIFPRREKLELWIRKKMNWEDKGTDW